MTAVTEALASESGPASVADAYDTFFRMLTGSRPPYAYQSRMAHHLCESSNDVLLTAPTGCGKTWATIAPFLHARRVGRPFADRVLYALPLRALSVSLKQEVERVVRAHALDVPVTIQTGDESGDETFDKGGVIFTTIDQILSSYLHIPLSLPRRLGNLNAGAIVGSLVVFDEAHLLEAERALQTMLHLVESHRGLARFVVATATLTRPARDALLAAFPHRFVEEGPLPREVPAIPSLAEKRRAWTRVDTTLSVEAVHQRHQGARTLIVVNTVTRAQELGRQLRERPPMNAEVLVLHSRMFREDRAAVEARLTPLFGPKADAANVILVATQVVEAGLDLSADVLLTELAPVNALIQRAGRCARYAPPRHQGQVVVFDLERNGAGTRRLGPYRSEASEASIECTWAALQGRSGTILGEAGEAALLEVGLADIESATFGGLLSDAARRQRDEEVRAAWRDADLSALRRLVRDIRAVPVFLADDPVMSIDLRRGPQSLSIPTPTWRGFVGLLRQRHLEHKVFALKDDPIDESPWAARWTWAPMQTDDWAEAYCLTSEVAAYDSHLGLLFQPSAEPLPPIRYRGWVAGPRLHYRRETYGDHVRRVLGQMLAWLERHRVAIDLCAARYETNLGLIRGAMLMAAGLHDAAKLDVAWQRAVHAWQRFKSGDSSDELLAHTDYDPATDAEAQLRPEFRRPNHAVEGALAVFPLVDTWLAELGCTDQTTGAYLRRIVLSAIATHHSPGARAYRSFHLVPCVREALLQPFLVAPELTVPRGDEVIFSPNADDRLEFERVAFLDPDRTADSPYWPLYSFVVRGLRLSDQAATKEGTDQADAARELR
jgi:CRISPR-associated endonuclease/helicase Cas3